MPLPREHGSWVMLFVAFLAGAITGGWSWALPPYLVAALALFTVRRPLAALVRGTAAPAGAGPARGADPAAERRRTLGWVARFGAAGGIAGLILLAVFRLWPLIPLGAAAAALLGVDLRRAARTAKPTFASEVAGAVGIALVAPGAYGASTGRVDGVALALWLACALHFVSGVFHVRMRVRWVKRPPHGGAERWATARENVLYQAAMLALGLFLARRGTLPPLGWLALLPAFARGVLGAALGRRETNFKRLGWLEAAYSLAFLALLLRTYPRA